MPTGAIFGHDVNVLIVSRRMYYLEVYFQSYDNLCKYLSLTIPSIYSLFLHKYINLYYDDFTDRILDFNSYGLTCRQGTPWPSTQQWRAK